METAEEFHQTLSQEEPKDYLCSLISTDTHTEQRSQKTQALYAWGAVWKAVYLC